MSEPVGNGPRSINIPGNSHKSREPVKEVAPRVKPDKVIVGKVVETKTPWWKRAARSMVAEDATSVGDYILMDVVIPNLKNLALDVLNQGAQRAMFGGSIQQRGRGHRSGVFGSNGSSLRTRYHDVPSERPRTFTPAERSTHDFSNYVLETRDEALRVIVALDELITEYGQASVADLYDILGITRDYPDLKWGWTNLSQADVRQVRNGYVLDLPRTEQLR